MPTCFTGNPAEIRTLDATIKLTRCTDALLGRFASRATIDDFTSTKFAFLEALYYPEPSRHGEISKKTHKSISNRTTVIADLDRHSCIRRKRDAHSRKVIHIHLIEAGKLKLEEVFPLQVLRCLQPGCNLGDFYHLSCLNPVPAYSSVDFRAFSDYR